MRTRSLTDLENDRRSERSNEDAPVAITPLVGDCRKLAAIELTPKLGSEAFHESGSALGFELVDFWRWSVSDLVSNATRGVLAEFLVAKALGIPTEQIRSEWSAHDLTTPDRRLKIEVKSAAYVQSWVQAKLSRICFNVRAARPWNRETRFDGGVRRRCADVYVFALLAEQNKALIDPLNLSQWKFYALATSVLDRRERSQHSITLQSLEKLTDAVGFSALRSAVEAAARSGGAAVGAPGTE